MREVGFQQLMVVPTLATLGLGFLLYSQSVSFTGPEGIAAPVIQPVIPAVRPLRLAAANPAGLELPLPAGNAIEDNDTIRATSQRDLMTLARESSGREDPFIPLIQPDPRVVIPPPIVSLPALDPLLLPSLEKGGKGPIKLKRRTVKVKVRNAKTGAIVEVTRVISDPVVAAAPPAPTAPEEPSWTVTGILSTGHDMLAILDSDGISREARVGDILEDNSRVVDITPQMITFLKNGKKYVKTIGEIK